MNSYIDQKDGIFPSVCSLDCPDQCGLLIHKKDGKIIKVEGDPNHPVTQGNICNKVRHVTDRLYDPNRIRYPLKRIGSKGEGKFERITWEEAIEMITTNWKQLIKNYGSESILPYSFYGNMGRINAEGMDRRFFHRLGSSILDQTICNSAGSKGYSYTMGASLGTPPEETIDAKLFIFWGINAVSTNMHQVALAQKARKKGAKIIVIDVHQNQTGRWADWFIPILPGTDTALALGLMHLLFKENHINESFLKTYTNGYEELRDHVESYDPALVSKITGVPKEDIEKLARLYGETSPSFIRIGNGLQHHDNGGMAVRTIACLPALTGQWQHRGGGAIKGNSAYLRFNEAALVRPDLRKNKDVRHVNMNQLGEALLRLNPPIRSLFIYNSNPAIVAPELEKVHKGLLREDLFTVVHDLFITETARFADLVLPSTSSYENMDFYTSYWHQYIQLQKPVIEKYGESKSNVEVFQLLAKGMGFDDPELNASEQELIEEALNFPENPFLKGISLDLLVEKDFMKADFRPLFPGALPTPSGKIELYSEKMAKEGLPPLPTFHPIEIEFDLPFQFVPGPNHNFLNSTFSNQTKHQSLEKKHSLYMNLEDAEKLGIQEGDLVKIWNHRGEIELQVSVGNSVLPGVVVSQGLWSQDAARLVNKLTPDRLSDMGGGATFFSGRVNVKKVDEKALIKSYNITI
jgi:anaerobic selenocysteine-containing dehydrogenase